MKKKGKLLIIVAILVVGILAIKDSQEDNLMPKKAATTEIATFAGGCFWCTESDFEKVDGVLEVISGYSGGKEENPSYKEVSSGSTGHVEAIQVTFNPKKVTYKELLDVFWRHIDPTDDAGSFVDRGQQYTSAIFYHSPTQKKIAEQSKKEVDASGKFSKPIVTPIQEFVAFYPAEEYHQDYYKKSPVRYKTYRFFSGRDQFLEKTWGKEQTAETKVKVQSNTYTKPSEEEIKEMLTPLQYKVTQKEGTEPPFKNEYNDNKKEGIYVDIVSGEPLFSSTHKYDSKTGWPSFTQPLEEENIVKKKDFKLVFPRTEIRSKNADSHLGHLFKDGPAPTGLRYCINSAALRFIPKEDLEKEGYGEYLKLFK